MGCIGSVLQFIFLLWVIELAWRYLVRPLFGQGGGGGGASGGASTGGDATRRRFLALLMPLLAKIAKADGRVSEREISGVESIFRELGLSPEERRYAAEVFSRSKDNLEDFDADAQTFARTYGNFELRVVTFQYMVRVACADGSLSAREREMLTRAVLHFRIPAILARQIVEAIAGGGSFRRSAWEGGGAGGRRTPPPQPDAPSREEDLALLGLAPGASDNDIRKAYRRKAKELHPDRLQAQGLPEAMLRQASERMAAINAAYARLIR